MPESGSDKLGLIRVEAPSYREALREISDRYGKDVSIVHTRVVKRKGMMGMLGATGVEVYVTGRAQYEEWRNEGIDPVSRVPQPRVIDDEARSPRQRAPLH